MSVIGDGDKPGRGIQVVIAPRPQFQFAREIDAGLTPMPRKLLDHEVPGIYFKSRSAKNC